jgi:hypothetical protein
MAPADPEGPGLIAGDFINANGFGEATKSIAGRPGLSGRPVSRADFPLWEDAIRLAPS